MTITTASLLRLAAQLRKPFEMVEAAQVDEIGIYVYISHGRFGWHRHIDEDEIFLVLSGLVSLESEWGHVTLHAGEMVLVPKGVGHRSSSLWRSTVILIRPKVRAEAQNGHRRLFAVPGDDVLLKLNLVQAAAAALPDFSLQRLTEIGLYLLHLQRGVGISGWRRQGRSTRLLLAHHNSVVIEAVDDRIRLTEGEIALVPPGTRYRLHAPRACTLLHLGQE